MLAIVLWKHFKFGIKSGLNNPGIFQNIFLSHFFFKTILKSQFLDLKTDFWMFQVHVLDLNASNASKLFHILDLNASNASDLFHILDLNVDIEL